MKHTVQSRLFQLFLSVSSLAIALIPLWLFLLIKSAANPQGFWQQLVIYGVGLYFGGAIQVMLLIVWLVILFAIWYE